MNTPHELLPALPCALRPFEPDPYTAYTIEMTARLVDVQRHTIAVYYKHGLVSPVVDPACGGYYFNDEAIRTLRRVEHLRTNCGVNLAGIKIIIDLMKRVERLQSEVRFLRQ
jgi:MerR family transcriptional regulator, heat shock protein HspR